MTDPQDPTSIDWRKGEIVVTAMSTRPISSVTGEILQFSAEALESMAEQVRPGFVPMVLEHLSLLPPVGLWHDADVLVADDGARELVLRGHALQILRPLSADPDPFTV